jgi:hypothetical protein
MLFTRVHDGLVSANVPEEQLNVHGGYCKLARKDSTGG